MDLHDWNALLMTAPTRLFTGRLVRCIPLLTFQKGTPPSYLFTSGAINRCNPSGIKTLYAGEDRETALAEYDSYYDKPEPQLIYSADFTAGAILDLGDPATCGHFKLGVDDFYKSFRLMPDTTPLQRIGEAVSAQMRITAIRFPSNARHRRGEAGFNFAVFPGAIQPPDTLSILGDTGPLESWP